MQTLEAAMSKSAYPGRGIVLGASEDGKAAVLAYFIMGRSVNSRNRVFVTDGDGVRTQASDSTKISDLSLIIYAPVRVVGRHTIVTNGDQTDTIACHLRAGDGFVSALRTRVYEPDAPNYTPRVSGLVTLSDGGFAYRLAILRRGCGCERFFFEYEKPAPGVGHFLHTYAGDGDPLPAFTGEPELVALRGGIDEITNAIWSNLNEANRVSLFVRFIELDSGKTDSRIINKEVRV